MRPLLPLTAVALLLAGCAEPGAEEEDDPLFGLCPQWAQGPGEAHEAVQLASDATVLEPLGEDADGRYLDRPLDLFRVTVTRVEADGVVELRAQGADGQRLSLRDYRLGDTQMVAVASIGPDAAGHEFDVFLSPVLEDAPSAQLPAALNWTLDGASAFVEYGVTYHYKVCGA